MVLEETSLKFREKIQKKIQTEEKFRRSSSCQAIQFYGNLFGHPTLTQPESSILLLAHA